MTPKLTSESLGSLLLSCLLVACSTGAVSATTRRPAGATSGTSTVRAAPASSSPCGTEATAPTYRHVVLILMENQSYSNIVGSPKAPYLNSLVAKCGSASNYHNITHHSLPNYLALTGGATLAALEPFIRGCAPSRSCEVTTTNLFKQASTAGGWKSYEESMPSPCRKSKAVDYNPGHNPAVYYTDLEDCSSDDVPLGTTKSSALLTDFSSQATAPAFSFVTPDLCDDMHGASGCETDLVKNGDTWLDTWVSLMTKTAVYESGDTAVLITWDEGAGGSAGEACADNTTDRSCHVPMIVIAPSVKAGTVDGAQLSHYSVLKTTEELLGYPELGQASSAVSFKAAFNL